jgi:hypothetical protein
MIWYITRAVLSFAIVLGAMLYVASRIPVLGDVWPLASAMIAAVISLSLPVATR